MTTQSNIEARLRRLEQRSLQKAQPPRLICLFGDDELPEELTAHTRIFRFDEARRVVRLPEEDRNA